MVKTRHSHEADDHAKEDFLSVEDSSKHTRKVTNDHENGSDDSGVVQFRQTRTGRRREVEAEVEDISPRTKRAAAKRVSYVEDCIDEVQNGEDFMYSTRRGRSRKPVVSDDDEDSAADFREDESPKQAAKYTGNVSPRRGRQAKSSVFKSITRSKRKTADYLVAHPSPSRQLKQEQLDELEASGTRRSVRQRRQLYGTLNEKQLDPVVNLEESSQCRKRRRLEAEEGQEEDVEKQEEEVDEDGFTDMYSRVKRKRKTVKRDMYGMPIEESSEDEDSDDSSDESSDDDDEDDDKDGENGENEEKESGPKSYFLRQNKPRTQLYNAPIEGPKRRRNIFHVHDETPHSPVRRKRRSKLASLSYMSPARRSYMSPSRRKRGRKRTAFHGSSSTSSSDSSSDEERFQRRKAKSMMKARNRCLPMNFDKDDLAGSIVLRDRQRIGASLADIDPMNIDRSVTFESVGGLGKHIRALKEMVVFPLLYPEIFERFKINPPRGVLFYGPPGTGKTLVARALANECSTGERKVAFYMRKGADCLSKWVGESERQLRLLFDQAYQSRPSIIFFDEIDGLAPVRSSRQDQIHSSIVSTLLALMDGLDSRGEIVVIGATNRIDSIDPALRRPGRFDREFLFPLPSLSARSQILKINTKEWNPKLSDNFVGEVAEKCVGYCGADVRALCTEAALLALRRRYPQIYTSSDKLQIDVSSINVSAKDFFFGMRNVVPTAQRSVTSPGRSLSLKMAPLLQPIMTDILSSLSEIFPSVLSQLSSLDAPDTAEGELESDTEDDMSIYEQKNKRRKTSIQPQAQDGNFLNFTSYAYQHPSTSRPRLLLTGTGDQGQTSHIGPAILHHLEQLPVHTLDLPALFAVSARSPEESCAQIFREARRTCPSIIYLPHINQWWNVLGDTVRTTLLTLIQDLDPSSPLLMLATSEERYEELDYILQDLFENYTGEVISMRNPTEEERRNFFKDLLLSQATRPPPQKKIAAERVLEVLPVAPPPEPRQLTEREIARLREQEEATLRELRLFLRDVLNKLGQDRKFGIFTKPVEIEDVPDYYDIIKKPMDLSTMMSKIDLHHYQCVKEFMEDIDLICANALEYNPDKDPQSRVIRHRACALRDTTYAITKAELDPEFEKTCLDVVESRKKRGEDGTNTAPQYYHTRPLNSGPFHPLAVIKHLPTPPTSNPVRNNVTSSPVRTSRRLHGTSADELPPLEEVERKARMLRRLLKEQNSPEKDSADSTKKETENTLNIKSTEKDSVNVKSDSGKKFPFKRNLSSSLSKKPMKKSIWDSSRYSTRRKRKRCRVSVDADSIVESNLDHSENESNNEENDKEIVEDSENCTENSQTTNTCERLSDMDTSSPVQAGARSLRTRQHSGGISAENKVHIKETSQKDSETKYLMVDVNMKSPEDGQKSPCSLRSDSQRSSQRSPRSGQRSPGWSDAQRSPARSEGQRSPARSDSQKSPRTVTQQSLQKSPLENHNYSKPSDHESANTPESPQRSHRPSSGQRSRSPRGSGGRSPRRLEMESNEETNENKEGALESSSNKLTSETAQGDNAVQGIPQDSISQDKVLSQGVGSELTVCDSGIGSSESSGDSNDSTGKAKELLKAHGADQEEILKDSNKPTSSGTNNENSIDKSIEEEHTQEDSPKLRVTRARIQSRSQQKALEVLQESTQHVVVDRERLVRLLDTTVELTEDHNVSRLEKLHSIFSQSIYQHRLDTDKTRMIQEMEEKLQQFTARINRQRNSSMLTDV